MSIDRAKALQSAQKYLAKGQLDRAIGEYERLVQADPKDARMLLKLGDLYTRQGANKHASTTYRKVADQYAEQGFFLKAVAVCKQILKLDPSLLDVWEKLAEMYEMLSLVSDAIVTYEQVADAQTRANNPRKAIRALQKLADLDPENVAARIRYAEALSKLNKAEEAAAAFRTGAELLKQQGRFDDYLKVGERLLFHQPDDYEFARELATIYLDRGDAKHSLAKLQACFNADPRSLETLQLLARAFEQLGQTQKTVSVLKEISRLHAADSRRSEQGSVLRRILTLDPEDNEARRELSQLGRLPPSPPTSRLDPPAAHTIDVTEEDYDLVLEDDDDSEVAVESGDSSSLPYPREPDEQTEAKVRRLLDECAVFVRYGLTDKMIAQLQEVLSLDPHRIEAREKLKEAFLKAKRPADAAKQLITLAELVAPAQPERAESYLREAIKLDPKSQLAKGRLAALSLGDGVGDGLGDAMDAPDEEEELIFVDEPMTTDLSAQHVPRAVAVSSIRPEESFASVMPGAHSLRPKPGVVLNRPPSAPVAAELDGDPEDVYVVEDSAVDNLSLPPPAADDEAPLVVAAEDDAEAVPEELVEALEEIEFYLKQGLSDEAQSTLDDALETYPNNARLLAYQRQINGEEEEVEQTEVSAPPAPPPTAATTDRSFELAQKLAEEVVPTSTSGAGPVDVADVLRQFKQGVAKQVEKADSATHYDLGIAYMEMGLNAEAIEEFKLCLDDATRICTAHTMIGLSFVAKGDMELGVDHFRQALAANPKPDEELGLWFEMGNAHELLGKNMEALVWYEKVEERDTHYRDVVQRIERLGTARTPEQEADEFDEMFDNMILKE